jgi:hypothetical protein
MRLAPLALFLLPILLGGCASGSHFPTATTPASARMALASIAWDGLGQDPNRPRRHISQRTPQLPTAADANREREQVMTALRPYSAAWWAMHDEIEEDYDRQLNRKLVICRGCLADLPEDEVTVGTHPDR